MKIPRSGVEPLEDFDYTAQPCVDPRLIEQLSTGKYIHDEQARNLIFLGPLGVGKTHLAIALGVRCCQQGHRAYFTTAIYLAHKLTKAVDENRLHREMKNLTRPKLLMIDEVGYLPFDATQPSLLFQVICQWYQKGGAIILTSNKAFSKWGDVFSNDAVMASGALDRLLHRSTVVNIKGDSCRMREKAESSLDRFPYNQHKITNNQSSIYALLGGSILLD